MDWVKNIASGEYQKWLDIQYGSIGTCGDENSLTGKKRISPSLDGRGKGEGE
jgi:hypothetical protein